MGHETENDEDFGMIFSMDDEGDKGSAPSPPLESQEGFFNEELDSGESQDETEHKVPARTGTPAQNIVKQTSSKSKITLWSCGQPSTGLTLKEHPKNRLEAPSARVSESLIQRFMSPLREEQILTKMGNMDGYSSVLESSDSDSSLSPKEDSQVLTSQPSNLPSQGDCDDGNFVHGNELLQKISPVILEQETSPPRKGFFLSSAGVRNISALVGSSTNKPLEAQLSKDDTNSFSEEGSFFSFDSSSDSESTTRGTSNLPTLRC